MYLKFYHLRQFVSFLSEAMIRDLYYLKMISLQARSKEKKYLFKYEKKYVLKSVTTTVKLNMI